MLLKPFLVPLFALTLATQQPEVDFLDTGIVFTGPVRFQRMKDSTTHFTLTDGKSTVLTRLNTERAFPTTANTSMSYQWAQKLSTARSVSLRIAEGRDMAPGTIIRSDLLDMVLCLRPEPLQRDAMEILYTIRCVAFDEKRQIKNATGGLIYEVDIVVGVPNYSPAATFLSRPREAIYVRLEP